MATLADRVEREDERRFAGRVAEIALLEGLLDGEDPRRVVLLHGPGGIGKSTLLRQLRRRALETGWTVRTIDGRDGVPTSGELAERLSAGEPGARASPQDRRALLRAGLRRRAGTVLRPRRARRLRADPLGPRRRGRLQPAHRRRAPRGREGGRGSRAERRGSGCDLLAPEHSRARARIPRVRPRGA